MNMIFIFSLIITATMYLSALALHRITISLCEDVLVGAVSHAASAMTQTQSDIAENDNF